MKQNSSRGGSWAAFFNYVKSLFGAGILVLPHAFGDAGIIAGVLVYSVAVAACIVSMVLIIKCKHIAMSQGVEEEQIATYPALAKYAIGNAGFWGVTVIVIALELCFCTGWVIVASDNIRQVADFNIPEFVYPLGLFPILAALACIRWLSQLWLLSLFGLVVYTVGVMGSAYWYIFTGHPSATSATWWKWNTLPTFFGTALYGLEAILLALPIEGSMERREDGAKVIVVGTTAYAMLAGIFGVVCYASGLADCKQTGSNLPQPDPAAP